ncbi:oligosaccharide flippase family protein [Pseudoalteromonas sp. SMS1]|uniref:lipopolysaccharide biosynthesis protein n=1 Tax=Pseudoalteromonas sp. SMS1 TaxID=2908894 RepID=UPI001F188309|nr:oligosaccharide flippase family protein [Pseudoalteromonas sp. SMS1]MCF2857416.1 oligosaccharide flippase family protein [Pseudoalteromonas sp. SMS1]
MRTLSSNSFAKAFAAILSANIFAQIIPFLAAPVLTRLYAPEDFGLFATITSIAAFLAVFASAKLELAIIVAKNNVQRKSLTTLCLQLLVIFSLVILFMLIAASFLFPDVDIGMNSLIAAFVVFLFIFFTGLYNILTCVANANSEYKKIALNSVHFSLLNNSSSIALGFLSTLGLIYSFIISRAFSCFKMLSSAQWSEQIKRLKAKRVLSRKNAFLIKRFRKYPVYSVPSEALDIYTKQMPIFLMGLFSGAYAVGLFALVDRVLSKPLSIVGRAVALPFRGEAVKRYNEQGSCRPIVLKVLLVLTAMSIVPFCILYFYAESLFGLVFGEEWKKAGEFAKLLVPIFFFQFITSPITFVFHIAGKQQVDFYIHIFMVIILTSCFLVGYQVYDNELLALQLYSVAYSFIYILYIYLSIKFSVNTKENK